MQLKNPKRKLNIELTMEELYLVVNALHVAATSLRKNGGAYIHQWKANQYGAIGMRLDNLFFKELNNDAPPMDQVGETKPEPLIKEEERQNNVPEPPAEIAC